MPYLTAVVSKDRREYQRLRLAKPILALIDDHNALIMDIGISGAFIEHHGEMRQGQRFRMLFRWHGKDVEFACQVVRSDVVRPATSGRPAVAHTAVTIVESIGDSEDRLQDMIATFVGKMLAAQKANAAGSASPDMSTMLDQMGGARRARSHGYITYKLRGAGWWRNPTDSPIQPVDGFTVASYEDQEELQALCQTYEQADEEGRRLIRLVAELSAMSVGKK
jgi:hypothetical protein